MKSKRSYILLALAAAVVVLGLASRSYSIFPEALGKYPSDALWALMVCLLLAATRPRGSDRTTAIGALAISFSVEFAQLYHAPWIDALRGTRLGHLVLGSHFHALDLAAYSMGAAVGWLVLARVRRLVG